MASVCVSTGQGAIVLPVKKAKGRWIALLVGSLGAIGCKASVHGEVKTEGSTEPEGPPPDPPGASTPLAPSASAAAAPITAFIGVTHGLALTPTATGKAACSCLAAVVGKANDSAFQWQGVAPTVGADAVVVAIGAAPCTRTSSGRGPSIQGVESNGDGVVVTLEDVRPGVPVARGAVVPQPRDGVVQFRAAAPLPYGQTSAGGACRVRVP